jgi:hypothetical protein
MRRLAMLPCLAALMLAGCKAPEVKPLDEDTMKAMRHIQRIGVAYNQAYQANGEAPKSADDLKKFLKKDADGADPLVSLNDGKPVVIVPGVPKEAPPEPGLQSIVAYEQTGVNGKRMMVDIRGMVHSVTEKEFAEVKFAGGHIPK